VRLRGTVVFVALLLAVAACTDGAARAHGPAGSPSPHRSRPPLFDSGGACQLLDYDTIQQTVGMSFDLAAASQQGDTYTCAVQARGASLPDLLLAVTEAFVDEATYKATVQPKGATAVPGVGKIAYSITFADSVKAGPGAEVGWLAGNGRLITLRMRLPVGGTEQEAAALVPKLVDLAKEVDLSSI
jgi:hypothetical protein